MHAKFLLVLLVFCIGSVAEASRSVRLFSISATGQQYRSGGADACPSSAGGSGTLSLQNLSTLTQTLTIKLIAEAASAHICLHSSSGISGWIKADDCWWTSDRNPAERALYTDAAPLVLDPNENKDIEFGLYTNFALNGTHFQPWLLVEPAFVASPFCCDGNPGCTVANNRIGAGNIEYRFALQVTVKEDRGAVIGAVRADAGMKDANSQLNRSTTFPLNGGRPF